MPVLLSVLRSKLESISSVASPVQVLNVGIVSFVVVLLSRFQTVAHSGGQASSEGAYCAVGLSLLENDTLQHFCGRARSSC